MGDVLVRGGTVVDGSGGAPFAADVRIRGGVIIEVGPGLVPDGEMVIDAHGALVTPGFVDSHTHYDLEMFWDPTFDPLPTYGVTTTIMGNCGFGIAPTRADTKADVADLLCFVEELPISLTTSLTWGWAKWSEYFRAAAQVPVTVTPYAFVAHNALRASVLGRAAWERASTEPELAAITALLDDALRAGALGLSSNWFDTDRNGALVPSRQSDDRELDTLIGVLARYPGAILQTIIRDDAQRMHVHRKAAAAGVRVLSLGDGTGGGRDDGIAGVTHLGGGGEPSTPRLGFESSIATAAIPTWHDMINGPADRKLALLADPAWRDRARHDWDHPLDEQNSFRAEQLHELILSDPDFADWPLGERAVSESLRAWSASGRRCTLLACRYDEVVVRHARFVNWRRAWSHIVEARACVVADPLELPSAIWSPAWVMQRLDPDRSNGYCGTEPERRVALKENLQEWLSKSAPSFAATTLGL